MRSLRSYIPGGGHGSDRHYRSRRKPGRVPLRAYPLWRRVGVQLATALVLLTGGSSWLWLGGYLNSAQQQVHAWHAQQIINLGITVERITVSGRVQTSTEKILAAVGMFQGQSLLDLDTEAAKQRVEALGWVRAAAVSRYFPDTIHIELSERRPFALWQNNGELSVIDREGEVITTENLGHYSKLPVVVGHGARIAAAELIDVLVTEPSLYSQVQAAARVGGRRWNLHLENGIKIQLPASNQGSAWQRLALLEQDYKILKRDIETIDLRVSDRLAVRLTKSTAQRLRNPGEEA
jgi:cell division protein FtsQ